MLSLKKNIRKIKFYAPYLGAAISVKSANDDFTKIEAQMKMRWYNRNLVGTHFLVILFDKSLNIRTFCAYKSN